MFTLLLFLVVGVSGQSSHLRSPHGASSLPPSKELSAEHCHELHNEALTQHLRGDSQTASSELVTAISLCRNIESILPHLENTRGVVLVQLGRQEEAKMAFERALELSGDHGHAAINLAHMFDGVEDESAVEYYYRALTSSTTDIRCEGKDCLDRVAVLNELALVLERLGELGKAVDILREAVEIDSHSIQSVGNLAIYLRDAGDLDGAVEVGRHGVMIAPDSVPMLHNVALIEQKAGNIEKALELWRAAIAKDPDVYQPIASLAHHEGYRGNVSGARRLYTEALRVAGASPDADSLRLQLATCIVPHIYNSTEHASTVHDEYVASLQDLLARDELSISDPLHSTGAGALGYYLEYVGFPDLPPRRLLAQVYWRAAPSLRYIAPFLREEKDPVASSKIKVGFLSAFVFTHSVGLLTRGVIEHLDRKRFEVVLLHVEGEPIDELTVRLASKVDEYVRIPTTSLARAQSIVAARRLDVLVFCEIGMNSITYFLAFSRLARRSALFWGHAVTSGISPQDCFQLTNEIDCGGIDYFVSSDLFEDDVGDYSEKVWLMRGLTTRFPRPVAPSTTELELMLPGISSHQRLYLIPQTLYKLHPDFDAVINDVLHRDTNGVIAMPEAQLSDWTDSVARRWDVAIDADVRHRLRFFKRLGFADFVRLAELADVVLDPFPVGGGRSSLEIFSVGTPIVMLEERTSVLQLTRGMYTLMASPCPECITHSLEEFARTAVDVAMNSIAIRNDILSRNSVLYENDAVVVEWEDFLVRVLQSPRPIDESSGNARRDSRRVLEAIQSSEESSGYSPRDFGWELVDSANGRAPTFGDPNSSYMVRLAHPDPFTGETSNFIIAVNTSSNGAIETARRFADYIQAEPVKFRWIAAVLQNGAYSNSHIVAEHSLELPWGSAAIRVGFGDDLAQLATWRGQQLGLNDDQISNVREQLKRLTPEYDSPEWIAARSRRDRIAEQARHATDGSANEKCVASPTVAPWSATTSSRDCELTIGITTCKRLKHFQATMRSLARALGVVSPEKHAAVCRVIVVDDASSAADKNAMAAEFPDFHFHYKPTALKGHAHSMNILLRLVETRYLLYLEDDWLALDHARAEHIIYEPLNVLRHAAVEAINEPLVQVIINDQSDRACAYAIPGGCDQESVLGTAGWRRSTTEGVQYSLHEFGVIEPSHLFTYWPGFTLNPAVWDVRALECGHQHHLGTSPRFDASDERFEQSFSLATYDAGLRVAYLPRVSFAHIGVDESAYGLNNISRPWDDFV